MSQKTPTHQCPPLEDRLPCCPLSKVREGTSVRIKQLLASPNVCQRLRELGMCEEQSIRCVLRSHSVVCQVCNMRLGLSSELADAIWVEPLRPAERAA